MMAECSEQNFGPYDLGELRLPRQALSIGQALSANFRKALSRRVELDIRYQSCQDKRLCLSPYASL